MLAITQYLKQAGYGVVDDSYYSHIDKWFRWYKGKVHAFHTYQQYNGRRRITRERKSLGMAKKIPEDWANLALNEKVEIIIDGEASGTPIHEVLRRNNFRVRGNQLLELTFALGTGAIVEYSDSEEIKMDYVRAGMIYPLRWENGKIVDCAFASERVDREKRLVYLNIHEKTGSQYVVKNRMFVRDGNNLTPTDLPEGVSEEEYTGSEIPFFQILKPNIANNLAPDCPMGISVYANAIDQMEGIDLVYDSYCNEFRLGKKRIVVPVTMAQVVMEEDGSVKPVFDDNDTEFYAIPAAKDSDAKMEEINMELRHEAHEAGVKTILTLLSSKCGLGNDRYIFEQGNVKTAKEVVSEKSELFQNLKKHELLLEDALIGMVMAIAKMKQVEAGEVAIKFDDSIIEDETTMRQQFLQEIRDGVRQKWEYRVKFFGEDEETAKRMVATETEEDSGLFGSD